MERIDYAVVRLRYMYRDDPIMDALYRGEINWGDIPDDDKPLQLISWKEAAKEEQRLESLTKKNEEFEHPIITETQPIVSPSSPWRKPDTCLSPLLKLSEFPSLHESITLTAPAKTVVTKTKSTVFTFERSGTPPTPTKKPVYRPPQKKDSAIKNTVVTTTVTTVKTKPKTKKKESPKSMPGKRTLFVHELPSKTTILELRAYFEKYGPIVSITLPKYTDISDPKYDLCKGFGHIRFEKPEDAMTAFTKEKNTIRIHNKRVQIEFVKNEV